MEIVVSAAVLAMVALAVLAGVDAAGSSSAREKARTVAASLAEQDQERMRAMRVFALPYGSTGSARTVDVGGTDYTVTSRAQTIDDATGLTPSCVSEASQNAYVRITSTVRVAGSDRMPPVTLASLVAPPVTGGWLVVQLRNRDNGPVTNMPLRVTGPESRSATTNDEGCALLGPMQTGDYLIHLEQPGWTNAEGQVPVIVGARVTAGKVVTKRILYDRLGTVRVRFDTRPTYAEWEEGDESSEDEDDEFEATRVLAPQPDAAHTVTAAHPDIPTTAMKVTPAAAPLFPPASFEVNALSFDLPLFPFRTPYGLHGGSCAGQNPTPLTVGGRPYFDVRPGRVQVDPGAQVGFPDGVEVREPALNLTVLDREGRRAPNPSYPRITVVLTYTSPDGLCRERLVFRGIAGDANSAVWPGGTCILIPGTGASRDDDEENGRPTCTGSHRDIGGTLRFPGIPFTVGTPPARAPDPRGRWAVCVDDGVDRNRAPVLKEVRDPDKGVAPFKVDLNQPEDRIANSTCLQESP